MGTTRFAVAVHILLVVASRSFNEKATSETIAERVNTNPVVIRRITGRLARAGLIRVRRGPGGAALTREAAEITLGDVWRAVKDTADCPLLPVHSAARSGPLAHHLGAAIRAAESALEQALCRTTLDSLSEKPPVPEVAE